jgi:hypothetical protein
MKIHAVGGDIVGIAPQLAQAAVLWLRKGFNRRYLTWDTQMLPRYRSCLYDTIPDSVETPWLWPHDRFFKLCPPDGRLDTVYIFSNPTDALGVASLDEVKTLIHRCLLTLTAIPCRSVAMIHIPVAPGGRVPNAEDDLASAKAMIEALREWDREHPQQPGMDPDADIHFLDEVRDFDDYSSPHHVNRPIDDVYLVDLENDFAKLL